MIAMKDRRSANSRFQKADLEQGRPLGQTPIRIKDEAIRAIAITKAPTIG